MTLFTHWLAPKLTAPADEWSERTTPKPLLL